MKIVTLKSVSSTEDYIRKILKKQQKTREDVVVIAETQKKGRGTKGRSFSSLKGGVYMSCLRFHNGFLAEKAFEINKNISVAVIKTLSTFGVAAKIKWPNDIYVNGKKICGMLINNSLAGDFVDYTVLGIGINVNNDIPEDLKDIATSLKQVLGRNIDEKSVAATFLYNLQNPEKVDLYARYSLVSGKKIKVFPQNGEPYFAVCEEVLPDGRLKLSDGRILTSEEVSIRTN